ncbi:unnamed protein product [Medioppia subpectinata]|uniref:Glucosylceramidase n=1 Tax=Medioppia subpectinata TaxID=1979941 RepID=A0A7R9KQX0_9ACAR|nr:unnamed protein product [Medioppia subpectinata]CAG2107753.1 unnamed protein product [Medioppia subpectinata]
MNDLNNWVTGWLEWNMVLDMNGGPTWMPKHGCGGPIYVNVTAQEAYKQPTYYALGQFSKFISPDSVRVSRRFSVKYMRELSVLTAKRTDNGVVVVALNTGADDILLCVELYQSVRVDILMDAFIINEEREAQVDFISPMPSLRPIAMLSSPDLKELIPRIITINEKQELSLNLIIKMITKQRILITSEYRIDDMITIYKPLQLNLIKTGDISYTTLYGFAVRKGLDNRVKEKLNKIH